MTEDKKEMGINEKRDTTIFDIRDSSIEASLILNSVYKSLKEKGYNPINQIVGYIISDDPTYITNYNNARSIIRKINRYDLIKALLEKYLDVSDEKQNN